MKAGTRPSYDFSGFTSIFHVLSLWLVRTKASAAQAHVLNDEMTFIYVHTHIEMLHVYVCVCVCLCARAAF
jgi:hypothetical protein